MKISSTTHANFAPAHANSEINSNPQSIVKLYCCERIIL